MPRQNQAAATADLLQLSLSDCIAVGTLRLDGLRLGPSSKILLDEALARDADTDEEQYCDRPSSPSTSFYCSPTGNWKPFESGLFLDNTVAKNVQVTPKRKRSESTPAKGKGKAASDPEIPTVAELLHLQAKAYVMLEYSIIHTEPLSGHGCDNEGPVRDRAYSILLRVYAVAMDTPGLNEKIARANMGKIRSTTARSSASRIFSRLMFYTRFSISEWMSGHADECPKWLLYRTEQPASLLEVYNGLDDPDPATILSASSEVNAMLRDILTEDAPEGMSSRLYDFQKACLWKLASRELVPQRMSDLTYCRRTSVADWDRTYFTDSNHLVWNTAPTYLEPKSAIVAEGMGTGKTCICLALILVTRHKLAQVAYGKTSSELSTVRTARYETFPWNVHGSVPPQRPPTLRELALDALMCNNHHAALSKEPKLAVFGLPLHGDLPYLWEEPLNKGREDTRSSTNHRRKIYISAATLVIVPDILVAQWLDELAKHVKLGALTYVKVDKNSPIPCASELASLDLVLVSETRVRHEESDLWPMAGGNSCQCRKKAKTSTSACTCRRRRNTSESPLLGVYWKRLIIDEGHKIGGQGGLVRLCMRIYTESRYVVSGTPSKNLVGIQDVKGSSTASVANLTSGTSVDTERIDFERLANIASFMGMEPFCSSSNGDTNAFMRAFFEPYRTRGETAHIQGFLERVTVRHRIPDIALPPMTRETVVLDFNHLERTTYNVLLAFFAANSVTSERQDQDYFFHPKQKSALNELLSNLAAAHLLFSSGELLAGIASTIPTVRQAIKKNSELDPSARWSPSDLRLINEALAHFQNAMDVHLWRHSMTGGLTFGVSGLGDSVICAWDGLKLETGLFIAGEKLQDLRSSIGKLAEKDDTLTLDDDDFEEELITAIQREKHEIREQLGASSISVKRTANKLGEDQPSARAAATGAFKKGLGQAAKNYDFKNLPVTSRLQYTSIQSVASTKIAYIVQQVLKHSDDKFLVFCGGSSSSMQVTNNNLYYISEALGFAAIQHLIFTRLLSQDKLAAYAEAFNRSPTFRVLLLDLKFASRGLTLTSATRVIFTEPIWHKDEEAQAVKRAHRLGQDRPVHVQTLVMRGSFEDSVMQRGLHLSRQEMMGAKTPFEDIELAKALRAMQFLQSPPNTDKLESKRLTPLQTPLKLLAEYQSDDDLERRINAEMAHAIVASTKRDKSSVEQLRHSALDETLSTPPLSPSPSTDGTDDCITVASKRRKPISEDGDLVPPTFKLRFVFTPSKESESLIENA